MDAVSRRVYEVAASVKKYIDYNSCDENTVFVYWQFKCQIAL